MSCVESNGGIIRVLVCQEGLVIRLSDVIKAVAASSEALPQAFIVNLWERVGDNLKKLHVSKSTLHGDLNPSNVLVNHYGGIQLCHPPFLPPGDVLPPTCFNTSPEDVSQQGPSDVFFWGTLLYTVACGQPPYTGSSEEELRASYLGPPPALPAYLSTECKIAIHFLVSQPSQAHALLLAGRLRVPSRMGREGEGEGGYEPALPARTAQTGMPLPPPPSVHPAAVGPMSADEIAHDLYNAGYVFPSPPSGNGLDVGDWTDAETAPRAGQIQSNPASSDSHSMEARMRRLAEADVRASAQEAALRVAREAAYAERKVLETRKVRVGDAGVGGAGAGIPGGRGLARSPTRSAVDPPSVPSIAYPVSGEGVTGPVLSHRDRLIRSRRDKEAADTEERLRVARIAAFAERTSLAAKVRDSRIAVHPEEQEAGTPLPQVGPRVSGYRVPTLSLSPRAALRAKQAAAAEEEESALAEARKEAFRERLALQAKFSRGRI